MEKKKLTKLLNKYDFITMALARELYMDQTIQGKQIKVVDIIDEARTLMPNMSHVPLILYRIFSDIEGLNFSDFNGIYITQRDKQVIAELNFVVKNGIYNATLHTVTASYVSALFVAESILSCGSMDRDSERELKTALRLVLQARNA